MSDIEKDIVHIARLALNGKEHDLKTYIRRAITPILKRRSDLATYEKEITSFLNKESSGIRNAIASEVLPVDIDSRQELLRRELFPEIPPSVVWPEPVKESLNEIIQERKSYNQLMEAGLTPSKSFLFVGPPGVGKTLAARWLAHEISRPLLTLDLAAVMSSYLGKTGNNIRAVLEFAKRSPSILLLDEFDAIAKKRDDNSEVGELKRLVTVLLQTIDDWPASGILIAATNHPELLDPAVWRRFDRIIEFPKPKEHLRCQYIEEVLRLNKPPEDLEADLIFILSSLFEDKSFSEIKRDLDRLQRQSFIHSLPLQEVIMKFLKDQKEISYNAKLTWAKNLTFNGLSQHKIHDITGLSRDTIRKHVDHARVRKNPKKT
jgi:SpoVK/Ycf46/Vps4 family AAA+-type ATPase